MRLLVILLPVFVASLQVEARVDFTSQIQPIFSEHCTTCHGGVKKRGGLSFISEALAFAPTKSGKVVIQRGRPGKSELYARITHGDPDERMPPEGAGLSEGEVRLMEQWMREGAGWGTHWSFRPMVQIPPRTNGHPIDFYIRDRLEKKGLNPSPPADRRTLIRRAYLDLIGLLPPLEEVEAFVENDAPDAFTRVVDHLLESPHFGERWGRHWLDQARYADSDGYEKDNGRPNAWRYRDWVIRSVNEDMPFDQFTREQIAGDLLPGPQSEQVLGTAFHRQTLYNREGGVDQEEDRVKRLVDRVNTTSTVWLGLTIGCTQCHDHPYDPFMQREFYKLFAFFNDSDEVSRKVSRQPKRELGDLEAQWAKAEKNAAKPYAAWVTENRLRLESGAGPVKVHPLRDGSARTRSGDSLQAEAGGIWFSTSSAESDTYVLQAKTDAQRISGFRLEVFADPRLPGKGPGLVKHGNFVLNRFEVAYRGRAVGFTSARADYHQSKWAIEGAIDADGKSGWAVAGALGQDHQADFILDAPLLVEKDEVLSVRLVQNYGTRHMIGKFRVSVLSGNLTESALPDELAKGVLAWNPGSRNAQLWQHFMEKVYPPGKKIRGEIDAGKKKNQMDVRVLAARKGGRETYVFHRGDFLQPKKDLGPVKPGAQQVLHPFSTKNPRADRRDLADWLIDTDNPLTARVRANKIWGHLFGRGLVSTMEDFGTRGAYPSHPDLLDHLAVSYQTLGWSRKKLIRYILLSRTYQQSSNTRPGVVNIDPDNRLLHRQNRLRVEAEILRDIFLDASGLLSHKVGGPSVYPPLPDDVRKQSYANNFKWKSSGGEDRYRRGMYTFFKRTAPDPNLITFDCPDANVTNTHRGRSNTPIQALAALHNEVFHEAAQAFSQRVINQPLAGDNERIGYAFGVALSREPDATEGAALAGLLVVNRNYYVQHEAEARLLVGRYPGKDVRESAAWVATLRMLLNLDEFINRG